MATKHTFQENVLRVVAVIGLIAVLLLGAWGIIQLALVIPTFLGNIGASLAPKNQVAQVATTTVQQPPAAPVKTVVATPKPAAPVKKSAAATKYVPSGRTTNLYGYPDLAVYMVNAPTSVRAGSQVSLQFIIENVGTNVVPANWIFTASLPYLPASQAGNPVYTYQSPVQQALYPGDKIVYTLGYSAQYVPNVYGYTYPQNYGGTQSASVTADPYNLVWELNESNNTTGISYQVY